MTYMISVGFLFLSIFSSLIQCQSGTFSPLTGQIDTLDYISHYRMITELGCIQICLEYQAPSCYATSYESYRQECRIITESIPSSFMPNQSFVNWRSYIRQIDS